MASTKIVLIEDEFFAASHLKEVLTSQGYWVTGVFHSGEEFLRSTDWQFDAAVVDIFLSGEITGLDLAAKLNERSKPFIFLTANQDAHTLKSAARLAPRAYISKPFQANDVKAALEIISLSLVPKLQVRRANGVSELHPGEIIFVRSDGVYVEIQTLTEKIVQRKLLKEIIDELPPSFIRVHRSFLVNADFIEQRSATHLTMKGHFIPISRSYKSDLDALS